MTIKHTKTPWTAEETATLVKMWRQGIRASDIAVALERPPGVVRAKVSRLRSTRPDLKKSLGYRIDWRGSKLKPADIAKIRKDGRSLRLIGEQYGVSPVTIHKVKTGETWKNV